MTTIGKILLGVALAVSFAPFLGFLLGRPSAITRAVLLAAPRGEEVRCRALRILAVARTVPDIDKVEERFLERRRRWEWAGKAQ